MQFLVTFIKCCKVPYILSYILSYILLRLFFSAPSCIRPCQPARPPSNNVSLSMDYYIFDTHMISGHEIAACVICRCAARDRLLALITSHRNLSQCITSRHKFHLTDQSHPVTLIGSVADKFSYP